MVDSGEEVDVIDWVSGIDLEMEDVAVGVMSAFIGSVCRLDRSEEAQRISNPYAVVVVEESIFKHKPGSDDAQAY
jgi:hypothetical protein